MAEFILTEDDLRITNETIADLDPSDHEFLRDFESSLTTADWDFVVSYARQRLRAAVEIGILARALSRIASARHLCDDHGVDQFLRSQTWLYNFGVVETSDEYFQSLSASVDNRLGHALDALIEIAMDRAFGTVDEEYARLFMPDHG